MTGIYYPIQGLNVLRDQDGQRLQFGEQVEGTTISRGYKAGEKKLAEINERLKTMRKDEAPLSKINALAQTKSKVYTGMF